MGLRIGLDARNLSGLADDLDAENYLRISRNRQP